MRRRRAFATALARSHAPNEGHKELVRQRGAWDRFVSDAEAAVPCDAAGTPMKSPHKVYDKAWAGVGSFAEAVALTRTGWPEGRAQIGPAMQEVLGARSDTLLPRRVYRVTGMYPCVPRALVGDPECYVARGDAITKAQPVVKFLVSLNRLAIVDAEQIKWRGAAILAATDAFEAAGTRVEIECLLRSKMDHADGPRVYRQHFIVKRAEDVLDLDKLAFVLMHPAPHRVLHWALMDAEPDLHGTAHDAREWRDGRGFSVNLPADEIPQDAIYFGPIVERYVFENAAQARAIVADIFAKRAAERAAQSQQVA